jgi:3',5'-cyclic AMP phosphodiesterase CpdA
MPSPRFAVLALICLLSVMRQGAAQSQPSQPDNSVDLLAMGDWGTPSTTQRAVSASLSNYVKSSRRTFDGMLLLGDNTYFKPDQLTPAIWDALFEQTYDSAVLKFPFYAALGNHDYAANTIQFQLDYSRKNPNGRWKMPAKYYRVDLPAANPIVTLLVLDSCMQGMTPQEWQTERAWMEAELSKPRAKWTIASAHHPLFSNGDHGDNGVLQNQWGPLFEKHGLDFFIAGHDHDLQHLQIDGWKTSFVMAGGGGAKVRPMRVDKRGPFSKSQYGFADLQFTQRVARCRIVSLDGKVLHEFARHPDDQVTVTFTTASDVAVPRTPKSINRPDAPTTRATTKPTDAG